MGSLQVIAFRMFALVGLVFASALVADDVSGTPVFCSFESGCGAVTSSRFGHLLGLPLSFVGLVAFGAFFLLTLSRRTMTHVIGPLAIAAGVCGILLVGIQFLILRQICRLCLVVDGAAVMLAAVAVQCPGRANAQPEKAMWRWVWGIAVFGVAALPFLWAVFRPPPPVPPEVEKIWRPGKINIVEITSFTCPYCRSTHEALESLRGEYGDALNFVRFLAVSPENHEAIAAAKAYLCAIRQNAGEIMAHRLFEMDDYSFEKLRSLALDTGLDLARFDADWKDSALDEEIASTREWVTREGLAGVPQIWVQNMHLFGAQSLDQLRASVRRASPHGN